MKALHFLRASIGFFILALVFVQCQKEELITEDETQLVSVTNRLTPKEFDNNLSFPLIWSDGYALKLRESPNGEPLLEGEWWYVWGDENTPSSEPICSCKPHLKYHFKCEDGSVPGDGYSDVFKAYLQKQSTNIWQAGTAKPEGTPVFVDLVDWGDALEMNDWNLNSKIPTELVLYENLDVPMIQFKMKHVNGWGIFEVDGLTTTLSDLLMIGPGDVATLYSHNVRFTIQKINVPLETIERGSLVWEPVNGWTESDPNGQNIINEPIFNQPIYETGDGPEYFRAEVNTHGKMVYGFTWDTSQFNEGEGYYRLTYSFDENCGEVPLNTYFDAKTEIIVPHIFNNTFPEEGGVANLDLKYNLTYMDICIKKEGVN